MGQQLSPLYKTPALEAVPSLPPDLWEHLFAIELHCLSPYYRKEYMRIDIDKEISGTYPITAIYPLTLFNIPNHVHSLLKDYEIFWVTFAGPLSLTCKFLRDLVIDHRVWWDLWHALACSIRPSLNNTKVMLGIISKIFFKNREALRICMDKNRTSPKLNTTEPNRF